MYVALNASVEVILYLSANISERVCTARYNLEDEYWATLWGECNVTSVSALKESHCGDCRLRIECSMKIRYKFLVKFIPQNKYIVWYEVSRFGKYSHVVFGK